MNGLQLESGTRTPADRTQANLGAVRAELVAAMPDRSVVQYHLKHIDFRSLQEHRTPGNSDAPKLSASHIEPHYFSRGETSR